MAQAAPGAEEQGGAAPSAPKKKSPLGAIIATALVVGPLAFGGFTMSQAKKKAHEAVVTKWEKTAPTEIVTLPLEAITVNLSDGERYVRCAPVLGFAFDKIDASYFVKHSAKLRPGAQEESSGGEGGEGKPKVKTDPTIPKKEPSEKIKELIESYPTKLPMLHDAAIHELTMLKFEQLISPREREKVKDSLRDRFTEILSEGNPNIAVKCVFFNEFIMQ